MERNYPKIKSILLQLGQDELLRDRIIVVGGTVPYLVSKTESVREHSDIDLIVKQENMDFVRAYLEKEKLPVLDSLKLPYNRAGLDYGIDTVIDKIPVNFAPYSLHESTMIQRNFLTRQQNGLDALATVTMNPMDERDMFMETSFYGETLRTYRLEMVKIMKEKSRKKKDSADIQVIDAFGYDEALYSMLKERLKDMRFHITPKNRLLRLLFP